MTERPILFSAPMVRAILDGSKTQTRRVVKDTGFFAIDEKYHGEESAKKERAALAVSCPYGVAGDRLWVRETWGVGTRPDPFDGWRDGIEYRADEFYLADDIEDLQLYPVEVPDDVDLDKYRGQWRPSIHMPRWASRITLEITNVRVERLQEISDVDAIKEGAPLHLNNGGTRHAPASFWFQILWNEINGSGAWDLNPWVWVIEFRNAEF